MLQNSELEGCARPRAQQRVSSWAQRVQGLAEQGRGDTLEVGQVHWLGIETCLQERGSQLLRGQALCQHPLDYAGVELWGWAAYQGNMRQEWNRVDWSREVGCRRRRRG